MSDDSELSDDELDDLISDLESRSGEEGGGSSELDAEMPDDEELQALLESDESGATGGQAGAETKVADREAPGAQAGPDLSELDLEDELPAEAGSAQPQAPPEESADEGAEQESPPSESSTSESTTSSDTSDHTAARVVPYLLLAGKWAGYLVPVFAFWWILGAYLAQWISAGWLIGLVATLFVVTLPKALYDVADRRGKFRWWLAGVSVLLTAVLVAPMPEMAGSVLAEYGHWPATALTEIVGAEGGMLVDLNQAAAEWLGRILHPTMPVEAGPAPLGN